MTKKGLLLLSLHTLIFAAIPDPQLLAYQQRYTLCHGQSDYEIADCLLNGNLDFSRFRGDRHIYRHIQRKEIAQAVRKGEGYDSGDEAEDIVRIKRIFNLLDHAGLEETPERTPEFETALLAYQKKHGLAVDGKIGPRTRQALKEPMAHMIQKVKKNITLEALSPKKEGDYILVNIPEFMMHFYREGQCVLHMKTVVGKPKMRTPIFHRKMKFIVENPTWNVPPSIYNKEYAHKSESQLEKLGLRYNSEGKLYQPAGRRNALGLVKFLFPNRFNVYMHDTPAKSLFARSRRAFSHGCIRLEKPMALLEALGYSYHPGKTRWITLDEHIPVYVEYHTVWIDEEGTIQFRPDIYGYERKLFGK